MLLAAAMVMLSGYYIAQVLVDGYSGVAAASIRLSALQTVWLVLGILGTLVLSVVYHVLAVRRIQAHQVPATSVALAYALGQVMRYIPGRVFGLVFQVKYLTGRIRAATIAMALLVQTFYDYAWAAIFLGSVLLSYRVGHSWPVALLVPALGLLWWLHRQAWAERALASPWLLRRFLGEGQVEWLRQPPGSLRASLALGLVWVPMLLGIAMALAAHVGFSPALALGALYLVSAVLSLLVVVVPSGLFVREALFAWLGGRYGFPPETLVFLGLLLRVAMTVSEVLLVGVCLAADSARSYRHRGLHRGQ
jgi:hypothetical protein